MSITAIAGALGQTLFVMIILFGIMKKEHPQNKFKVAGIYLLLFVYECYLNMNPYLNGWFYAGKLVIFLIAIGGIAYLSTDTESCRGFQYITVLFLIRVMDRFGKLVVLSIDTGFDLYDVKEQLECFYKEYWVLMIILYLLAYQFTKFMIETIGLLAKKVRQGILLIVTIMELVLADRYEYAWEKMFLMLAFSFLGVSILLVYRMKEEYQREEQLHYGELLEKQMQQKREEVEQIRNEVAQFYDKAAKKQENHYSEQLLEKLDEIIRQEEQE